MNLKEKRGEGKPIPRKKKGGTTPQAPLFARNMGAKSTVQDPDWFPRPQDLSRQGEKDSPAEGKSSTSAAKTECSRIARRDIGLLKYLGCLSMSA